MSLFPTRGGWSALALLACGQAWRGTGGSGWQSLGFSEGGEGPGAAWATVTVNLECFQDPEDKETLFSKV